MSLLTKILEKLGLKKHEDNAAPLDPKVKAAGDRAEMEHAQAARGTAGAAGSNAISEVDVVAKLESMAAGSPGLDWKVSIVDLLKLLDIDSSKDARTELAKELGCPPDLMSDSAKMNVWLHKAVLRKIAQNGGNVPADLLD